MLHCDSKRLLSAVVSTVLLMSALPAGADVTLQHFAMERLTLSPTAEASLVTPAGRLLEPGSFRLALAGNYSRAPLTLRSESAWLGEIVRDQLSLVVSGAYAFSAVELGFSLPVVAHQQGDALESFGLARPSAQGLGMPRLQARMGFLQERGGGPLDLGASLEVAVPTGSTDALQRDDAWSGEVQLSAGKRLGPLLLAAQGGFKLRPSVHVGTSVLGSELPVLAAVATQGQGLRAELSVHSAIPLTNAPVPLQVLGALRYPVARRLEFFAAGGPGFGAAPGVPTYRIMAGVNLLAVSPSLPAAAPLPIELPAAPRPQRFQPPPRVEAVLGSPSLRALYTRMEAPSEGLAAPELVTAEQDTDHDTVVDGLDNCPRQFGPASNRGCPASSQQLVFITPTHLEIEERIYFAFGKSRILARSTRLMDQVAAVLNNHPEFSQVVIEGHTDSQGRHRANLALSLARAHAVRQGLISRGVSPDRLQAVGRGPDEPSVSNLTIKGRELNRRVEFLLNPSSESSSSPRSLAANAPSFP